MTKTGEPTCAAAAITREKNIASLEFTQNSFGGTMKASAGEYRPAGRMFDTPGLGGV